MEKELYYTLDNNACFHINKYAYYQLTNVQVEIFIKFLYVPARESALYSS